MISEVAPDARSSTPPKPHSERVADHRGLTWRRDNLGRVNGASDRPPPVPTPESRVRANFRIKENQ
jgi:hypothetical protein